ncbi:MAG TPA: secondary thiamine-phosphate synthase enzyme YjbQ [Bauldia sp.]|nr:secondary thiamine-phosphate synthase enzyme YjbQ [Bauldia sp.]
MRQSQERLAFETPGRGFVEITREVAAVVAAAGIRDGLATVFCRHTSASLLIQENADPDVRRDLETFFARIAPEGDGRYIHDAEGPDDMPAHIRAALTATTLGIPVSGARPVLGAWQGIYLYEHRRAPHRREVVVHVIGD